MAEWLKSTGFFIFIKSIIFISVIAAYMFVIGPLLRDPESRLYFIIGGFVIFLSGMTLLI